MNVKVFVCNENLRGLERLYANVANRSEVTKEIITNALNLGTVEFSAGKALLAYTAVVKASYRHVNRQLYSLLLLTKDIPYKTWWSCEVELCS